MLQYYQKKMKILQYLGYVKIFYECSLRNNNILLFNVDYCNNDITKKIKVCCVCTDLLNQYCNYFFFVFLLFIFCEILNLWWINIHIPNKKCWKWYGWTIFTFKHSTRTDPRHYTQRIQVLILKSSFLVNNGVFKKIYHCG